MKDSLLWDRETDHTIPNLEIWECLRISWVSWGESFGCGKEEGGHLCLCLTLGRKSPEQTFYLCFLFCQTRQGMPTPQTWGQLNAEPEGTAWSWRVTDTRWEDTIHRSGKSLRRAEALQGYAAPTP